MPFVLRRATVTVEGSHGENDLELAQAHAQIAAPRRGTIAWDDFDPAAYTPEILAAAADAWRARVGQEYHSLALFTQISSQIHLLGAPLDWAGAFARMIGDEVRHTELCARMAELLGPGTPVEIEPSRLHLPVIAGSLQAHVRAAIVTTFCIGETLSGRMFRRCLRAATVPLARDIVRTICDDETFHGRFGWEAAAILMRDDAVDFLHERTALARQLPEIFSHYRDACGAARGRAWAHGEPEIEGPPNFGTLTHAGYAAAFFDGMEEDVVPALVAIGFPEAEAAWATLAGDATSPVGSSK